MLYGMADGCALSQTYGGNYAVKIVIKPNTYFDSVSLMSIPRVQINSTASSRHLWRWRPNEQRRAEEFRAADAGTGAGENGDLMIVINGKAGADNEQLLWRLKNCSTPKRKVARTRRVTHYCQRQKAYPGK